MDNLNWQQRYADANSDDPMRRQRVSNTLEMLNGIEFMPVLSELIKECVWPEPLCAAASTLLRCENIRTIPTLLLAIEKLQRLWPNVELEHLWEGIALLVAAGDAETVRFLLEQLKSSDAFRRVIALIFLRFAIERELVDLAPLLRVLTSDPDKRVRQQVVYELGNLYQSGGTHQAIVLARLVEAGNDPDADIRLATVKSLPVWPDPVVVSVLERLCEDPSAPVRAEASQVLHKLQTTPR